MIKILKKLNVLLDKKQKLTMVFLVVMMVIGAGLQVAGVGMIVPVVSIVMDAEAVKNNQMLATLYRMIGGDATSFSIMVMCLLIVVFIIKNAFLYVQMKMTYAFVYKNQFRTSERMMKNYLRRDYEYYLSADTAVVQRNITSDVNNMYALILSLLQLISDGIVLIFLVTYCFVQDPAMTILTGGVLLLLLWLIKKVLKPIMHKAGEDNQNYYSGLFKWISQTVQGIKEIKVAGKEQYFVTEYIKCGEGYVNAVQKYSLYNSIPKLIIETVCVICMIGYILFMMLQKVPSADMMETLTTFAAAALVLLPCVNRINNQINSMAYFEPFFMGVSDNLQDEIANEMTDMSYASETAGKLVIKDAITLSDISYAYPNTEKYIFKDACMTIPVGAAVGIVGTSGAGKTTIVDILLGLLKPIKGRICADQTDIYVKYRQWIKSIGYIPQMIFMLDDTVRRNVAFGVPEEEIDEDRIWEVLKEAQLDEFVRGLPMGLDTGIGERGIRLSGGQRQRIGIARALYDDPEILILDEATSALDNDTEAAIMEAINRLHGKKTLVIIAHRLQTIENCEMVYRVEGGRILREK